MFPSVLVRFAVPVAILVVLASLYVGLSGPSQTLLTAPPGGFVALTLLVVMGLALFAGYMLARDIPSRLARRLTLIAVIACSLYAGGVDARGIYAVNAFEGDLELLSERWMTLSGSGTSITATSLERRKTTNLPAASDAVAAAGPGSCVTVEVERSATGAERIKRPEQPIQASDISAC